MQYQVSVILVIVLVSLIYYSYQRFASYYYRTMDEILPNLYLGNLRDANNESLL